MTPRFSIVTPTYNCGAFLEDCIQSVLAQNYANFEHIIIDGASTDDTLEVLKRHPHLRWVSEPDSGEAEALNKGLKMVTGDVVGWLNADDFYLPGCFEAVTARMNESAPNAVVYGNARFESPEGVFVSEKRPAADIKLPFLLRWWKNPRHFHQPAIFYPAHVLSQVGPFRDDLHFSVDYEQWLRVIVRFPFVYLDRTLAVVRVRADAKSSGDVPLQHASHQRVSLPYHGHLTFGQKLLLNLERRLFEVTTPLRQKLALGQRCRQLVAALRPRRGGS